MTKNAEPSSLLEQVSRDANGGPEGPLPWRLDIPPRQHPHREDSLRDRFAKFTRWAFCPHKRVLVKIVPHNGEAVYKLELSHRHLACAAIVAVLLIGVLFSVHVADVRAAEARARTLAKVDAQQRRELAAFSKQTNLLWQKVGKLQRDNEEIHRLTRVIVPKAAARPGAHKTVAGTHEQYGFAKPTFWGKIATWFRDLPVSNNLGFAAEAAELTSLSNAVNQTGTQTTLLEARIRAAAELKIAAELARERYLAAIPSIWPTLGYVSSGFGYRSYPDSEFHPGLDIVNDYGAPIYATAAGVVAEAGWYYGYGLRVVIDHGNGLQTWYAHDSQLLVSAGQVVRKGEEIATIGSTGFATGPHCHYQINLWGKPIDPTPYLSGAVTVVASSAN